MTTAVAAPAAGNESVGGTGASSSSSAAPAAAAAAVQPPRDQSSLSNPDDICVTHLDWTVLVDFDSKCLTCSASYTARRERPAATEMHLDTHGLSVSSVTETVTGRDLPYRLEKEIPGKSHLGRRLVIEGLVRKDKENDVVLVTVQYRTTSRSSALQWLPASQTAGKSFPYLFTQCQAIHARSLVPCQDMPGVKMTYEAAVTSPAWATCVMSAVHRAGAEEGKDGGDGGSAAVAAGKTKTTRWEQKVPISSYLLAMAVGNLSKRDLSTRCSVWSEPELVDAAAHEFADTEDFLSTAEAIAGRPYAWGRYDLLCLPPSFPFGGMENPCLTFVTPTLLAGDRSLAAVVAHEIAHSWTGNLVTNATWDHFWLNEGWTTWFQRKITSKIRNDDKVLDFEALCDYKMLKDSVDFMPEQMTRLVLDIGDGDPDNYYSSVAYEKGFNLLMVLERRVGREAFEAFFRKYVARYADRTLTSYEFRDFFAEHFSGCEAVRDFDWETWFHGTGMPVETADFDRTMGRASEELASRWLDADRRGAAPPSADSVKGWSTDQITLFLDTLKSATEDREKQPLSVATIRAMDGSYGFASSRNSEILSRYLELAVVAEDRSVLPVALRFVTSQGRMKFVRPLYRTLFASKMGKEAAVQAFLENADFYHPICAKMVAQDLKVKLDNDGESSRGRWGTRTGGTVAVAVAVAAAAVLAGCFLLRRNRR